ncbi:MAG: hypothetical protein ACSLFF_05370 [Solirubrobacterales bacterium]
MSVLLVAVTALLACSTGVAQAGAIYDFDVELDDGVQHLTVGGDLRVTGLNSAQTRRIIVAPPSGPNRLDSGVVVSSSTSYSPPYITGLAPGDTVSVRQPGDSPGPTEVFTIPDASLNVFTGATVLTGSVPAGWIGSVRGDYRCELPLTVQTVGAGAFSVPYSKVLPGEVVALSLFNPTGDRVELNRHSPGETPCVEVEAILYPPSAPGGAVDPSPFEIDVDHLILSVSPSVRLVLRRGSTILADVSEDISYAGINFPTKPLPGDVVDVYRPKTAPTPTFSMTLPQVSGVFDPAVDKVAMKTPAAGMIAAYFCRTYICSGENLRASLNVPAGVNLLDFSRAQSYYPAMDLRPDDLNAGVYEDPDHTLSYYFEITPGDLVAPTQSIKLAGKIKRSKLIKAFKKGFKIKLQSTEAGTAKLSLTLPPASTKSKKKPKKKPRTITLASATKPVRVGSTTIFLKFTKSGKRALKKLPKKGSRSAVLTSTVTDASGNASTIVKKTKIKP